MQTSRLTYDVMWRKLRNSHYPAVHKKDKLQVRIESQCLRKKKVFLKKKNLKVFPGSVSFQMEAFKWTKGPSHRATRDTPCPLSDGGKLSLWCKLWATVHYVRSSCPVISIARKNWWKKFKIKRFASGCDDTWDFRSIERKDKLSFNDNFVELRPFLGNLRCFELGRSCFRLASLLIFLIVYSTTQNIERRQNGFQMALEAKRQNKNTSWVICISILVKKKKMEFRTYFVVFHYILLQIQSLTNSHRVLI